MITSELSPEADSMVTLLFGEELAKELIETLSL